ncbi:uncharacterized protein A4U43_C04F17470 [Asparagus officinalis]|uniref:DNA helicase n=1 Tax=Asparagus officinalis TaxID=4686 RepID=A0A5P1F4B2_ASPOF|nr:uncharacterized protein A4U43_C04F17470 [Asparagus officinalis]
MAPRKRSSSKKSNHTVEQSQPSKFGIQHFFERHSQANSASQNPNPNPNPNPNEAKNAALTVVAEEDSSPISPEITKSIPHKRFKFSPGMLIKQSQDDGGDEITWKISPVNERLKSLTSRQLPRMMKILADHPRSITSTLHPCSGNEDSSCSAGKLERWLSSPTAMALDKSLTSSRRFSTTESEVGTIQVSNHGSGSLDVTESKGPFHTPPSLPYGPHQLVGAGAGAGVTNQPETRQYRKQLLELLDQVEDAITEDPEPTLNSCEHLSATNGKLGIQNDLNQGNAVDAPEKANHDLKDESFLVLEVSEKHKSDGPKCSQNPFKVLRLLNETSGQERVLHLCNEWFYSLIGPGDTINVIGEFDNQGKCVIDHDNNLLIIHPDILVSGTRVASSFNCPRRAVLDERLKCSEHSVAALIGTLLHQIFQAGLVKDSPTRHFLEEYAGTVLHNSIENLYACGASETDVYSTLTEAIPKILNWLRYFKAQEELNGATVDFGQCEGQKSIHVSEVIDIEEMAWAPRYGLKGMIDASLRIIMSSSCGDSYKKIMPLEFKTGKGTTGQSAMEHCAQVILYTLLMSDRYLKKDINSGLLYYLHTDQTLGIKVQRSDVVGLIMRRNELATDILKASSTQNLPPMIQNLTMCKGCRHLNICTVYHKAHGGNKESSGLGDLFDEHADHLTAAHNKFLRHWDRLIDLEAKVSLVSRQEILHPRNIRDRSTNSLSPLILDVSSGFSIDGCMKDDRFIYNFIRQKSPHYDSKMPNRENIDHSTLGASSPACTLRCGDRVILSTESGRTAVANGIICDIDHINVSISFTRRLRLPGSDFSSERSNLTREVWRIDKDDVASSFATMRFNLIQLFVQRSHSLHLRKMIVDLEAPRFDSAGVFSQDPALSYVRSEKSINNDQRRAVHKILSAKDYTLILGMPGTGKTSTMVHAVKALLIRGASILLTSYTNSAVDNLLIKLKAQGIDFIRIGRHEVVHDDIRDHCLSEMDIGSVHDIKQRMEHVPVVGVTCLGINHPLLANKKFDICIMDEAGQITLPVALGPLMLASTFVLVGDHYQLPPLVQSVEARENGMSISLFCRLSEAHPQAISALQCQYRMCSAIMELSNTLIYGNRLHCGSSAIANAKLKFSDAASSSLWLKQVLNPDKPVIFINTGQSCRSVACIRGEGAKNCKQSKRSLYCLRELVKRDIPHDEIGIITPYNSQTNLIRHLLDASVEINTIDKYQGRDKDCILLSFVRSSENPGAYNSSLLGDWHRINVSITRAKKKLIMVGSCRTLSKVPLLKLLIDKVDEQGGLFCISNEDVWQVAELKKCSQTTAKLLASSFT